MKTVNWKVLAIGGSLLAIFWATLFTTGYAVIWLSAALLLGVFGAQPVEVRLCEKRDFTESELVDKEAKDLLGIYYDS